MRLEDRCGFGGSAISFDTRLIQPVPRSRLHFTQNHECLRALVAGDGYGVDQLPVEGFAAKAPIPADYWATYRDAINQRWDGSASQSPAEKFAQAFGLEGLPDVISSNYGIDRYVGSRKSCFADYDCQDLEDGSTCARRDQNDEEGILGQERDCHEKCDHAKNGHRQ